MTDEIVFYTNPMSRGRTVRSGAGYIAGERFSAADVYCGFHIGMGLRFGSIENGPAFVEYWKRVSDRDAYRRATALDDALMPK
jgi:glutathione S-transferase